MAIEGLRMLVYGTNEHCTAVAPISTARRARPARAIPAAASEILARLRRWGFRLCISMTCRPPSVAILQRVAKKAAIPGESACLEGVGSEKLAAVIGCADCELRSFFSITGVEGFMNLGLKTGLLGTAAAMALAVASVPAYAQDDLSTLRQQLETMKERLAKLEADKAADKRRVAAAAAVEAGDKPRSWKLPGTNTSMNIGGFVKMQVLWDFGQSGQGTGTTTTEGAGVGVFPVEGTAADNIFNGGNFQFTARRSRFWVQTWTPTDWGELRTYIEADFAGAGAGAGPSTNLLRLRQAFGTLGPVLFGKTQTLFGGLIGQPELLHDGAPMAPGALRVEQLRYSHNFGGGLVLSVALESGPSTSDAGGQDNVSCLIAVGGTACPAGGTGPLQGPVRWPDFTAALQWNFPNGALYASGMIGQRFIDNGTPTVVPASVTGTQSDDAFVWGGALGGRYDFGRVEIGGLGYIGQGIGNKYGDGGATGFIDAIIVTRTVSNTQFTTDLNPVLTYGVLGYVQVKLTDTIRATAAYNWTMHEVASEVPFYYSPTGSKTALTGVTNYYWAAFGNILWNPVPQVTFGAEYSYQFASKYNGPNANAHRLQFAGIYRF
jgi:hypothetical protein